MDASTQRLRIGPKRYSSTVQEKFPRNIPHHLFTPLFHDMESPIRYPNNGLTSPLNHKRAPDSECSFCQEALTLSLPGETIIRLSCDHFAHKDCLLLMFDVSDLNKLPKCGICEKSTKCIDEKLNNSMIQDLVRKNKRDTMISMDSNSSYCSSSILQTPKRSTCLLTPPTTPPKHKLSVLTPRVSFISEYDQVKIRDDGSGDLRYIINVKPPRVFKTYDESPSDMELKLKISEFVKKKLNVQFNLGKLVMFDKLEISTTGREWEHVIAYLFENYVLFYDDDSLVGAISIENDIHNVNFNEVLILNLSKESIPELLMTHKNELITSKWEWALNEVIHSSIPNVNLFQLSSTCWEDYQDEFIIQQDLISLSAAIIENEPIPNNLLEKVVIRPEDLDLNLIVGVPLVNQTQLTDYEYKSHIQGMLRMILKSLRNNDRLGLVFIGIDSTRAPACDGIFIGCISKEWSGWEDIINEINIVPNYFENGLQELTTCFKKCLDLYPFIPITDKTVNILFILNANDYPEQEEEEEEEEIVEELQKIVTTLNKNLAVTVVRIGSNYTRCLDTIHHLLSSDLSVGYPLVRFSSFEEFIQQGPDSTISLQKICIPKLSINIKLVNLSATFDKVDINGELINTASKTELNINVKHLMPDTERNIMFKMHLDLPKSDNEKEQSKIVPAIEYTYKWLDEESESKVVKIKVNPPISPTVTPPLDPFFKENIISEENLPDLSYFLDIPLLPPLSPSRDHKFARRETEMEVIKSLKFARETTPDQAKQSLNKLISLVYGFTRGVSSKGEDDTFSLNTFKSTSLQYISVTSKIDAIKKRKFNNDQAYVEFLVDSIEQVINSFDGPLDIARTKCQDLAISLM